MLQQITPVVLTYNEEANIGRSLERLFWARDIILVDSFSVDRTVEIARADERVRLFQRRFDTHAQQWSFAIEQTDIRTEWVLALDADYVLTNALIEELRELRPTPDISGMRASFRYCVYGRPLRSTLYPPVTVLYRRNRGKYIQDGHTQRLVLVGNVGNLKAKIDHDDRKSLAHWQHAQARYVKLEADKIAGSCWSQLDWPDRVRAHFVVAPVLMFAYCLFIKKCILDGRPGLFYALQRTAVEILLSLRLMEKRLGRT